jgi:hypothetical protein
MEKFNLNKIIADYALDIEVIAKELFPNVKYPKLALDRILKGEACLDTDQLQKLAAYLGVLVADLFFIDEWQAKRENNHLMLINSDPKYMARVNFDGSFISIYEDNKKIADCVVNKQVFTFDDFIKYITNYIKNLKDGNS